MKTWILAGVLIMGMTMSAQTKMTAAIEMNPEQRVTLQTKEMTLALDLNDKQQKDVSKLFAERNRKADAMREQRKAAKAADKKPTVDERFAMKNKMLDEQIAMKAEMKKILTPVQFEKWEKMKEKKHHKMKKSHRKHSKPERR